MKKILLLFIVCLAFTGCFSTKKYHVALNEDVKQVQTLDGITVSCEFLNEGQTNAMFGRDNNPFYSKDFAVTPIYFFVFEVEIKNETNMPLKYDCRDTVFYMGEKDAIACTVTDLETMFEEDSDTPGTTKLKMERNARATMFKNVHRIMPGESIKRLMVFKENFRQRGDGRLELNLLYQNGEIADTFAFDYSFQKLKDTKKYK
ncbi:MAG: hypothetical protein MJ215_03605 [Spirochaetia bacterium]|nr:hypothetical protein [Spirochaetia bacterium]